jgi:CAAX prenyl protease-like protein
VAYTVKVVIVCAAAWMSRSAWKDLRPWPRGWVTVLALALGLLVTGLWVALDAYYPHLPSSLGKRVGFDPTPLPPVAAAVFVCIRMFGLALLVPLVEELFWRSFLIRWLIDQDFQRVPIGRVTPLSAGISSLLFAAVHPEWLPALLTGLLWAYLLWQAKSVSACVISHATANFALGVYVIVARDWKYW